MMKVRLVREASIRHKAGEIVEVSPAEFNFLQSVGAARPAPDKKKKQRKQKNEASDRDPVA